MNELKNIFEQNAIQIQNLDINLFPTCLHQKTFIQFQSTLKGPTAKYVDNAFDLQNINANETDHLMGLFAEGHLAWIDARITNQDPSLTNMTKKAIEILNKNSDDEKGFFLMVEGGRIDHAHHETWANRSI